MAEIPQLLRPPIMTTLPNGLRIATTEIDGAPMKACVTIDCGSRFDPDDAPGISCFIFRRAALIHLAHSSSREVTSVLLEAEGKDISEPLRHLADFVQNTGYFEHATILSPSFSLPGLEKFHFVCDKLHEIAFKNHPLGRFPLGPVDSSLSVTKKQIDNFVSTHYTAPRTVVTVTGDTVKHKDIVKLVKKFFKHLSSDPTTGSQLASQSPATFTASEVRMLDENQSIAHLAVAFCGISKKDPDYVTLQVIQKMLGSVNHEPGDGKNMGSELAAIVDIKKLAKTMWAIGDSHHETGLFGVYASAKPHCLDDLAKAIMSSISKLSYLVLEKDVARGREQLVKSFTRNLFSTPVAADIGKQIIKHGRRIHMDEVFKRINAVDAAAVKRVANRLFFDKDIAIVAMGPIKNLPDYEWFRAQTRLRNH